MKSRAQQEFEKQYPGFAWESQLDRTKSAWITKYPEQSHCGTEQQTNNTERTVSMPIYRVALTVKPSALEQEKGQTERMILPSVEVIAEDMNGAIANAVHANAAKLKPEDIARATVYVDKQYPTK